MSLEEKSFLVVARHGERGSNCNPAHRHSSSSEEWQEGGDGSTSYSSHTSYTGSSSDSYFANWENHVNKDGTLFYAEYSKVHFHAGATENAYHVMKKDFKRSSTRRSNKKKGNRFMKFLAKNDVEKNEGLQHNSNQGEYFKNESFLSENQNYHQTAVVGDVKEVEVVINPEDRFKFGRRASVTEAILGISTAPFADDENKLVLAGHMVNSAIIHEKSIKIGDLFVSVNDVEVTTQNINELLEQFTETVKAVLKFQRILSLEQVSSGNSIKQVINFESFVKSCNELLQEQHSPINPTQNHQQLKGEEKSEMIFSLILLNEEISNSNESCDVIFCYPSPEVNALYNVRGTFLTLNSILKSELKTEPLSTTIKLQDIQYNVSYMSLNKILILFSTSEGYSSPKETRLRLLELFQYIQFHFLTIEPNIDGSLKTELRHVCEIINVRLKKNEGLPNFETLLQGSRLLPLPKEAQLRIFDALSEMEAMDYRDWNDEPLNSHREFFIYGSAVYFRSYLLANQMPTVQLHGLEAFLRCRGIFDFIEHQNVRDLVVWMEIPIPSQARHFLVISSRNQLLLAVILQAFDLERRISENGIMQERIIPPSLFYIEEIQETLDHLRHGGIEALARAWIASNKRPQIVNVDDFQNTSSCSGKKSEVGASAMKHCSLSSEDVQLCSSLGGSSAQSLSHSEGSNQKLNDCDSDSDWDGFPGSHKSSSGFDMSEMTESLLKEVSDVVPTKITAGKENVLFNYVHLDIGSGVILAPPEVCTSSLTNKFRKACHIIHTVLQNTKKFRRLLSQEPAKPNTHKSLVAIKEHGIMITDHNESSEISCWVIGRLFASPPRELYVCHRSDVPQNLVEIAFRLSFITAG